MAVTLDKATLESKIHDKLESFGNVTSEDAPVDSHIQIDELAAMYATEIETYVKPLLDAHNALQAAYDAHTHGGVVIAVVGQAVGTIGNTAAPN